MSLHALVTSVNLALRIGFFVLMGIGLLLASVFLWFGKISGSDWVMLCGILFGADRFGNAVGEWVSHRTAAADNGTAKPQ